MWGCKILCENLWWLWARQEQPILTLSANFARRGDSLLAVVRGCYLHLFAACSAAGEQRNILSPRQVPPAAVALRNAPAGAALCAPAVFAPRFARLRGDSRAGKKITFPQKRKSQKEAPDTAWRRNTAPWVLSQQDKPSRMDTMAQFTLSHMILIIVPCRDNGVNTTRNVAPRRIFCIFVSTFGQYVKTACKPLFSQRNISCRPSIFAAAIAALPLGNTAQFPPDGLSTAPAAAALRIMRYCLYFIKVKQRSLPCGKGRRFRQSVVMRSLSSSRSNLFILRSISYYFLSPPICWSI